MKHLFLDIAKNLKSMGLKTEESMKTTGLSEAEIDNL